MRQLRQIVGEVPGVGAGWRLVREIVTRRSNATSSRHRMISVDEVSDELVNAWKSADLADRQRWLVSTELERMYEGEVVPVYRILLGGSKP